MNTKAISDMSFEEAVQRLESIIAQIETGNLSLDQAITCYEQGVALKNHCQNKLASIEEKIVLFTQAAEHTNDKNNKNDKGD